MVIRPPIPSERLASLIATAERIADEWLTTMRESAGARSDPVGDSIWLDNVDGTGWDVSVNYWPLESSGKLVVAVAPDPKVAIGFLAVRECIVRHDDDDGELSQGRTR